MRGRSIIVVVAALVATGAIAPSAWTKGGSAFSNTPLIATASLGIATAPNANSTGDSEPAIAFGGDGAMAVDGLAWLPFQVNLWKGVFGSTPSYFGDEDADVEITSAGTLLLADLDLILNKQFTSAQLGVNITRCPAGTKSPSGCQHIFIDVAGADREWITSAGTNAWLSYHDSQSSTLIRVKRSTDDGLTWRPAGSPIPGQGAATGDATFNNSIGPIVADPSTGVVYESYAAGEPQTKGSSANYNNIYVSRSTDGGQHWVSTRVFHADPFVRLNNFWPSLAVDPVTHAVSTAWTDQHGVSVSTSTDGGVTWSAALKVSNVATTVMPWLAARNGKVDVVYYGSTAASVDDPSAVWNVYDSQLQNGSWQVLLVSNTPNRVGPVCLEGAGCVNNTNRELLDLFEVAEDPLSGKAAVIYTDSTIDTWVDSSGATRQLPEIVIAFER